MRVDFIIRLSLETMLTTNEAIELVSRLPRDADALAVEIFDNYGLGELITFIEMVKLTTL